MSEANEEVQKVLRCCNGSNEATMAIIAKVSSDPTEKTVYNFMTNLQDSVDTKQILNWLDGLLAANSNSRDVSSCLRQCSGLRAPSMRSHPPGVKKKRRLTNVGEFAALREI